MIKKQLDHVLNGMIKMPTLDTAALWSAIIIVCGGGDGFFYVVVGAGVVAVVVVALSLVVVGIVFTLPCSKAVVCSGIVFVVVDVYVSGNGERGRAQATLWICLV